MGDERGRQLMGWMAPWRHRCAKMVVVKDHQQQEPSMGDITTIGLDLAKSVFQVHAVDEVGRIVMRKRLRRSQVLAFFAGISPCLVGLEACATAHYWARELIALGHEARLMPPNYVKAYVKRNKHDVADAEAICEAVRRPSMRFVPVKTVQQQSALMMHRARDLLIRQRTMLVNALRAHLAEFGLIEAQGMHKVARLIAVVMDEEDGRVPDIARQVLKVIVNQIEDTQTRIAGLETQVLAWHKSNPVSQRLATIPGIGPIIATAIAATVAEPNIFRSGREFAAWLGLVPRQSSTGGKARLGGISKRGDSYLRRLLVNSAHTVLLCSKQAKTDPWLTSLLSRKPRLVAAVALANKTARVAWAIMSRQDTYRHAAVPA
jgi:transposase